jgi:hypothetical protein
MTEQTTTGEPDYLLAIPPDGPARLAGTLAENPTAGESGTWARVHAVVDLVMSWRRPKSEVYPNAQPVGTQYRADDVPPNDDLPAELRAAVALNLAADELRRAVKTDAPMLSGHEGYAMIQQKVDELAEMSQKAAKGVIW